MELLLNLLLDYRSVALLPGAVLALGALGCTIWAAFDLERNGDAKISSLSALVSAALGGGHLGLLALHAGSGRTLLYVAVGAGVGIALAWIQLMENSALRSAAASILNPDRKRGTLGSATFCLPSEFEQLARPKPDGLWLKGTFYGKPSRDAPPHQFTRLTGGGLTTPRRPGLCLSLEDQARGMVVIGAPGSGKSQAGILPVAADSMALGHSAIIVDPQGELTDKLLDFATVTGHQVIIHDPTDPQSYHYNLAYGIQSINPGTGVNDAQAISQVLTSGTTTGNDFWQNSAQNLMAACLLHYPTLSDILGAMASAQQLAETLARAETTRALASAFISDLAVGGRMSTSVLATMQAGPLSSWAAPDVARTTDASEFNAELLVAAPTLLILKCPARYMAVLGPYLGAVLRRFMLDLETIGNLNPGQPLARPVKIILDEFPMLGRLDSVVRNVNLFRKLRVGFMLAAQTLSQFEMLYGRAGAETLLTGLATQIVFGGCDPATASYVSRGLGRTTEREPAWREGAAPVVRQRDLMTLDEVITPPKGSTTITFRYATASSAGQAVMLAELAPMYRRTDWAQAITRARASGRAPYMLPRRLEFLMQQPFSSKPTDQPTFPGGVSATDQPLDLGDIV